MRAQKLWKTILVTAILAFGLAAFVLPETSLGVGEVPYEHWVRSAEAIAKENAGYCADQPGTQCYQSCIDFQGTEHPMPNFECF